MRHVFIQRIEKALVGDRTKPVAVYFDIADVNSRGGEKYGHDGNLYHDPENLGYPYKLTSQGLYFWNSRRTLLKIKHYTKESDCGFEALKLTPEDLPFIKDIFGNWDNIHHGFVRVWSSGQAMIGHICTTYDFPDGTSKVWYSERFKDSHPESLEKMLERAQGKPLDQTFPSDFCVYMENIPFRQHYKHGRLDYYLEHDSISIEDERTIQQISDPKELIALLTFFSLNPETAIERLLGDQKS